MKDLERLCAEVSGGDQQVRFELRPVRAGAWDMELFVRKGRFEQCIVYAEGEDTMTITIRVLYT